MNPIVSSLRERVHGAAMTAAHGPTKPGGKPVPKAPPTSRAPKVDSKKIPQGGVGGKQGGSTKSTPATPATPGSKWDESPAGKGWSEDKVVRDTDANEEGQFDFKKNAGKKKAAGAKKGAKGKDPKKAAEAEAKKALAARKKAARKALAEKKRIARAADKAALDEWTAKRAEEKKKFNEATQIAPDVANRQKQILDAQRRGWPVENHPDGSVTIQTPSGPQEMPSDDAYLTEKAGRDSFLRYATSKSFPVKNQPDGSVLVDVPWSQTPVRVPSEDYYDQRDKKPVKKYNPDDYVFDEDAITASGCLVHYDLDPRERVEIARLRERVHTTA